MKKEKKLKLDVLSSNELDCKEAIQISGGYLPPLCRCACRCLTTAERISIAVDVDELNVSM